MAGLVITPTLNVIDIVNGTASLNVAAGAVVDVNANLTVGAATNLDEAVAMSSKLTGSYASAAEITTGTEAAKAIAPDQLATALFAAIADIPYATAAGKPGKLTKGAANLKMFMNAGATAPEWASGQKIISATRLQDALNGNVSYSGVGFKPNAIICIAACGTLNTWSIGFSVATANSALYYLVSVPKVEVDDVRLVYSREVNIDNHESAYIASVDSDGFTLAWVKGGTPTSGTILLTFLCFR